MLKLTPPGLLICSSWCMTASSHGRFKNSKMMVNHLDKEINSWCVEILCHPEGQIKLVKPFRMKHKLFVIDDHTTISPNLLTLGIHVFHLSNSVQYFKLPKEKIFHHAQEKRFTLPKKKTSPCQSAQATIIICTMGGEGANRVGITGIEEIFWKSFLLTTVFHRDKHCRGSSNL